MQLLRSVVRVYQTHRVVGRVVCALKPLIDADGGPDEQVWLTVFRLGFLSTIIDRLARRIVPELDAESAGLLQIEVWTGLTDLPGDLVGERLLALSLAEDPMFLRGCEAGVAFVDAFVATEDGVLDGTPTALELWRHHLASESEE